MSAAFQALLETTGPCVLFESTAAAGPRGRLSLLARSPRAVLVQDHDGTSLVSAAGRRSWSGDPFDALRRLLAEIPDGRWPDEGGIAGALAYDFARPGRPPAATPRLVALAVDRFLVEEDGRRIADGPPPAAAPWAPSPGPWSRPSRAPAGGIDLPLRLQPFSSLTRDGHRRLVLEIKDHITAGDVYQANLSQRFRLPFPRDGLSLYAALRAASPAPFAGYLRAAGLEIVSASPERLVSVAGGVASARPIAGTRPRASDPRRDRALAAELILSEKERAEHLMLVDLARNDLGQVAELGSVHVDELMTVEDYSHVRHIVSNVTARLAPGRDALAALRALFPGGTITGVPKRRCMDILDTLEPVPRGFYTGALFYVTPSGRLDANILIRSALVTAGEVTFHAGGGIVADSDPDREYEETLHKAEGLRVALEAALAGPGFTGQNTTSTRATPELGRPSLRKP
jgi:anthranilate/para-aminobenzoate synthase component I